MANETQKDPRKNFAPRFLPWLLGAAMFAVFGLTLNRWINLANLGQVANLSGYVWQPQLYSPLMWLATYPVRWLAPAHIPLALNIFSALCGALTWRCWRGRSHSCRMIARTPSGSGNAAILLF